MVCTRDASSTVWDSGTNVPQATVGSEDLMDLGGWGASDDEKFPWRVFQYSNNAWDYAVNRAGYGSSTLGMVTVRVPSTSCTGASACYTRSTTTIHTLADGINDRSPDVIGHEYGHFVMHKSYGSYNPNPTPVAHTLCQGIYDRGQTWSEGFAVFFGTVVDNAIYPTNGASGDTVYSSFGSMGRSIETLKCPASIDEEQDDWPTDMALWDLRDSEVVPEGWDNVDYTDVFVHGVLRACQDSRLRDFFDGTGTSPAANSPSCNWTTQGGSRCDFVRVAEENLIAGFNTLPTATLTSQTAFEWVRGQVAITATATDDDCGVTQIQFGLGSSTSCAGVAILSTDVSNPFSATWNTLTYADGTTLKTCARERHVRICHIVLRVSVGHRLTTRSRSYQSTLDARTPEKKAGAVRH